VVTPQPELSDAEVEELLGAYALDACDPAETAAVEAVLARRPDHAVEAARLANAAAWIGATEAFEPPRTLRVAVMGTTRCESEDRSATAVDLYRAQ
jgi:anti-sigma factor RsiW